MKRKGYLLLTMLCAFSIASMTAFAEESAQETPSIATTSVAIAEILDLFGYENVVGVPETSGSLPERYKEVQTIGGAMSPDLEILKSISPDLVLSPNSLEASLAGQYTAAGLEAMFMNMSSVQGLYDSIDQLGELLECQEDAAELRAEYEAYMESFSSEELEDNESMVLMCFPTGFYVIATEKSYVGNLVELAGGHNVYTDYEGDESGVVSINPEDMLLKNPDKIFIFAHYNEEEAFAAMEEDLATNSTWQYYDAVKNDQVYFLSSDLFGMSATMKWTDAVEYLRPIFYGES